MTGTIGVIEELIPWSSSPALPNASKRMSEQSRVSDAGREWRSNGIEAGAMALVVDRPPAGGIQLRRGYSAIRPAGRAKRTGEGPRRPFALDLSRNGPQG